MRYLKKSAFENDIFLVSRIFFVNFDFKNGCKMNLRIITENHAADSKMRSPLKIDFTADWTDESIPTAWELKFNNKIKDN